jgi:hypothetical protein
MKTKTLLVLFAHFALAIAAQGFTITLEQVGSNVVATGNGAINLTGLTFVTSGTLATNVIVPNLGIIQIGGNPNIDQYSGLTGPTSFGSGGTTLASSGSGDFVGLFGLDGLIDVPHGYVSGAALSDSMTFNSATFASLGVTPGTYVWTWGNGENQNFTLVAAVPEPSTLALLAVTAGLGFIAYLRRR